MKTEETWPNPKIWVKARLRVWFRGLKKKTYSMELTVVSWESSTIQRRKTNDFSAVNKWELTVISNIENRCRGFTVHSKTNLWKSPFGRTVVFPALKILSRRCSAKKRKNWSMIWEQTMACLKLATTTAIWPKVSSLIMIWVTNCSQQSQIRI